MIKKGFTLIELLITIAIIGILSAAVLVGINPIQKLNQANDSKAKSDVGQAATALQSYFTSNQAYPATTLNAMNTALTGSGDLTANMTAGTGYTYTYTCTTCSGTGAAFALYSTLKAGAATNSLWCFRSATGTTADVTSCAP